MLSMHPELFWLAAVATLTALLWLPYIVQFIAETGLVPAVYDPTGEHTLRASWAQRAHRAHLNAVENLVVFAPLAIAIHVLGLGNDLTANATMIYFYMRAAHYLIYLFGIPVLRTLVFFVSWGCQMTLAAVLFGAL